MLVNPSLVLYEKEEREEREKEKREEKRKNI